MTTSVSIPKPLLWSEGMLLGPQHMQQNDIYWQRLLCHQMAQLQPYYWGVLDLALDKAALSEGKIRLERLEAVLPDGLVVQHPGAGDELCIDLAERPEWADQKPVKVWLGVPVRAEGAASGASPIQRYEAVTGALELDENTGEGRIPVARLHARITLLTPDKLAPKYIAMPLLELKRELSGSFALTDFHPPLLRTSAADFLGAQALSAKLKALTIQVRDKARELTGQGGGRGNGVVRHLVAALPELEVLVYANTAHPFDAYRALANVVGQIAAIADDPIPLLMEPYRHDDPMPGFLCAMGHVGAAVERLRAGYETLVFEPSGPGTFQRLLPVDAAGDKLVIELRAHKGQTREALALWAKNARIGSDTLLPVLRQRRLPGAGLRILRPEELAEVELSGVGLLLEISNQRLEVDDRETPVIEAGKALCVEGNANGAPAAVVMYRRNGTAALAPSGAKAHG